jgi:prevent-host-death family protein
MRAMQVNMHEAKSRLSDLARKVHAGERVVIARAGKPYVELVPFTAREAPREPGGYEDEIWIAPDFDETPIEVVQAFEGK